MFKFKNIRANCTAEKNGNWKGDNVSYHALHYWIKSRIDKPKACVICNKKNKLDLSNKSGKYLRDLTDWWYICRSCHTKKCWENRRKGIKRQKPDNWFR